MGTLLSLLGEWELCAPAHSHPSPRHSWGTLARAGWDPTDLNLRANTDGASGAGEN